MQPLVAHRLLWQPTSQLTCDLVPDQHPSIHHGGMREWLPLWSILPVPIQKSVHVEYERAEHSRLVRRSCFLEHIIAVLQYHCSNPQYPTNIPLSATVQVLLVSDCVCKLQPTRNTCPTQTKDCPAQDPTQPTELLPILSSRTKWSESNGNDQVECIGGRASSAACLVHSLARRPTRTTPFALHANDHGQPPGPSAQGQLRTEDVVHVQGALRPAGSVATRQAQVRFAGQVFHSSDGSPGKVFGGE